MLDELNLYLNSLDNTSDIEYHGIEAKFDCAEPNIAMIFDCDAAPIDAE